MAEIGNEAGTDQVSDKKETSINNLTHLGQSSTLIMLSPSEVVQPPEDAEDDNENDAGKDNRSNSTASSSNRTKEDDEEEKERLARLATAPKPSLPFGEDVGLGKYKDLISALCIGHGEQAKLDEMLTSANVVELCDAVKAVLNSGTGTSLVDIKLNPDDTLIVVGDVHGQLQDLTRSVMPRVAAQGANAKVLFLGDYVDRGPQSVEALMLLLALKCDFPDRIWLLRGNHEDATTSKIYGFFSESTSKFNEDGPEMWGLFNQVFCHLPVAAVVTGTAADGSEKRFAAMHGGLCPDLRDLSAVSDLERSDYGSMLDNISTNIIDGLLWSDPTDETPAFKLNERGCGYLFGENATTDFCEENRLEYIVRAHQMTMTGYVWTHSDKCCTVFSAPNYCGISGNLGAVMLVSGSTIDAPTFEQYDAVNLDPPRPRPQAVPYFSALFANALGGMMADADGNDDDDFNM